MAEPSIVGNHQFTQHQSRLDILYSSQWLQKVSTVTEHVFVYSELQIILYCKYILYSRDQLVAQA